MTAAHPHHALIEVQLTRLWAEALDLPDPPPAAASNDTFTDLGGDSISATLLLSRIKENWQLALPIDCLFDGMTLPRLIALIEQHTAERPSEQAPQQHPASHAGAPSLPHITRQPRDQALPLSHSQRRMWLVQAFAPDTTAYNVTYALRLNGPLNREALVRAVNEVWARHDTFRTRFELSAGDGQPHQWVEVASGQPIAIHHLDLRATSPTAEREAALHRHLEQAARKPLDLVAGPLWHVHLLQLGEHEHVLAWIAHHILVDLWANQVVAREIAQVYSHLSGDEPLALPDVALDCADHGHWQNAAAFSNFIQPQLEYWLPQLAGLPPSNMATDHPMSPDWYSTAQRITHLLPPGWVLRLRQFASSQGCSPFMVLLAALGLLMGRQGRQEDVGILTPVANRHHTDTTGIVASLVNTLVMRIDLSGLTSCDALLARVKQTTLAAYGHQDLPFDMLVERFGSQSRGHQDLPLGQQVMLNVANAPSDGIHFAGLDARRLSFNRGATQLPLTFIADLDQTASIVLEYADSLFEPDTAQALVSDYLAVLDQIVAKPTQSLASLHWHSPSTQALLAQWNNTHVTQQPQQVDAMLRAGAAVAPDDIACTCGKQTLTHRQLNERAQALAHQIAARGLGPGHRIGIHLPRGLAMLIALRGVIMSGAAYVPLDPRYPAERLQDMAADAQLGLIIAPAPDGEPADENGPRQFDPGSTPVLTLADATASLVGQTTDLSPSAPPPIPSPNDPLYVIYTSGSTGRPKGVVVPHRTVANFLASMAKQPGITAQDKLLAVTTLSFDIAVLELLLPLSVGAHIIMASEDDAMDGPALGQLMDTHHITMMQATPSTWRAMLDSGWQGSPTLGKALIGGEALRPELAQRLLPCCAELWNMYGPTETTVWSTCWQVTDAQSDTICIGRPIDNTRVRILDLHGHDCPIGTPGEIIIEGEGVALGYWQRPDLTAERFIFHAHVQADAPTGYRTGDLGRWRRDGQLEHLGRIDHQIKIRGHRIEPGDIEHALMQHPQVLQAVVLAHERSASDVRLVAYVVRHPGTDAQGGTSNTEWTPAWRPFMRQHLPEHMVPQHLLTLDAMPLLANGKLNRHALPKPVIDRQGSEAAPSTPLEAGIDTKHFTVWEARLAQVWRELLGLNDIRLEDNFFDLGGHSLLAMQAIERVARETAVRVTPRRYIFESLSQLAASYEREAVREPGDAGSLGGMVKRWFKGLAR